MQPYAGNNPQNSSAPQKAPDLALCLQPPFRNLNNLLYLPHTCKGTQAKGDFSGCNTHMAEEVVTSLLSCVSGLCPSWRHRGLISRIVWFKSGACKGNVGWCFKCLLSLSLSVCPPQLVSEQQESRPLLSPSIDDFLCETKCDELSRPVTSNTAGTVALPLPTPSAAGK